MPLTFEAQWLEIASKMSAPRRAGKRHAPDPADPAPRDPADCHRGQRWLLDQDQVGAALADTDRPRSWAHCASLETMVAAEMPLKTHVLVVAMGRQGGREIGLRLGR